MDKKQNTLPAVISQIDKYSQWYAENETLRNCITGLTHVGIFLDHILAWKGKEIIKSRTQSLFVSINQQLSGLHEEKIDKEYLNSEDFFDLVRKTLESTYKTSNKSKIDLFAKILKGAIQIHDRNAYEPMDYLEIITMLTPKEIEVARAVYYLYGDEEISAGKTEEAVDNSLYSKICSVVSSVNNEDIPFIMHRLQAAGLIRIIKGGPWAYTGFPYEINIVFRKLMAFIEEDSNEKHENDEK